MNLVSVNVFGIIADGKQLDESIVLDNIDIDNDINTQIADELRTSRGIHADLFDWELYDNGETPATDHDRIEAARSLLNLYFKSKLAATEARFLETLNDLLYAASTKDIEDISKKFFAAC